VPWLKLFHITAVIVWCGALLYLPALVAGAASPVDQAPRLPQGRRLLRSLYNWVATPAALIAIASGTAIFVLQGPLAPWLMLKLAMVALLVLGHGFCGLMVLRAERGQDGGLRIASVILTLTTLVWLASIAWLVLRKPG